MGESAGMQVERTVPWQVARLAGILVFTLGLLAHASVWSGACLAAFGQSTDYWVGFFAAVLIRFGVDVDSPDFFESLVRFWCALGVASHGLFVWVAWLRAGHRLPVLLCVGWGLVMGLVLALVMTWLLPFVVPYRYVWIAESALIGLVILLPVGCWALWWPRRQDGRWLLWCLIWFAGAVVVGEIVCELLIMWKRFNGSSVSSTPDMTWLEFIPAVVLFFPVVGALASPRRHARQRLELTRGLECFKCGYDLTGTLVGGGAVCPECGAELTAGQVAGNKAVGV